MKRLYLLQFFIFLLCSFSVFSQTSNSNVTSVSLNIYYNYQVEGEVNHIVSTFFLPKNLPNKQRIINIDATPPAHKIFKSGGNQYIQFVFDQPRTDFVLNIKLDIELYRYDLMMAEYNRLNSLTDISENFLRSEQFLRKTNKHILEVADTISGKTQLETVHNLYDFVVNHLEYDNDLRENLGAIKALKKKRGDCTEYADLFVTLCRAKEIPARVVAGCIAEYGANPNHHWAEVFIHNMGWVPFDPTFGDSEIAEFNQMPNKYIYYSNKRRDKILFSGNGQHKWWVDNRSKGEVKVKSFYDVDYKLEEKFLEAQNKYQKKDFDIADSLTNELLEIDPENSRYHALKGLILSQTDGDIEAFKQIQYALLLAHNSSLKQNAYYAISSICALRNQKDLAMSFLKEALKKETIGVKEVRNNINFDNLQEDQDFKTLLEEYDGL